MIRIVNVVFIWEAWWLPNQSAGGVEAEAGIEPALTELQSAA